MVYCNMSKQAQKYYKLMKQYYPEELESNGFVEMTEKSCLYMDKNPKSWEEMPAWFREKYKQDPKAAILEYSYEFLLSFA